MVHAKQDLPRSSCLSLSRNAKRAGQLHSIHDTGDQFPVHGNLTLSLSTGSNHDKSKLPAELLSAFESPPHEDLASVSILLAREVAMAALLDSS